MKEKIKKILSTTMLSALTATAIGCSTNGNKIAKNIDKSMAQFVSSVNKLDYVETTNTTGEKVGKIVETSTYPYTNADEKNQYLDSQIKYLNNQVSDKQIENTIIKPTDRTDDFKLFILSDIPFVTLTSDDNNDANLSIKVKFTTNKIKETSTEIDEKINSLILKRSILLIYVNEINNGNVTLSEEDKTAINAYVNVIKENTSYLNGNRGMVKNQLKLASDLVEKNSNDNLVNYYIIKSGEALETRASKFDSTISAIDSITEIIENNLTPSSNFYNTKLSDTYENIVSNLGLKGANEITNTSSNREIAETLTNTLTSIFPCEKEDEDQNSQNGIATLPLLDGDYITSKPTEQNNLTSPNMTNTNKNTVPANPNTAQNNNVIASPTTPQNNNLNRTTNNSNSITNNNNFNRTTINQNQNTNNNFNRTTANQNQSSNNNFNRTTTSQNVYPNNNNLNRTSTSTAPNSQIQNSQNLQNSSISNRNLTNNQSNLQNLPNGMNNQAVQNNLNSNTRLNNNQSRNVSRNRTVNRRSNMNNPQNNNQNTIRAERVPNRISNEENVKLNSVTDENRAIKVPYQTSHR